MNYINNISFKLKNSLITIILGFAFCILSPILTTAQPLVIEKGSISTDTTWDGEVLIKADVEIAKGATLTIKPGTVVKFEKIEPFGPGKLYEEKTHQFPRAELIIRGKIIAKGTPDKIISFTSADSAPRPADWGAINLLDSQDNIIEYCDIGYAHTAVHAHGGRVTITDCYIHDSGVAVGMKNYPEFQIKSEMVVHNNMISTNGGGILFGGNGVLIATNNNIVNNELFGIYCKKGSPASVIKLNSITKNGKGALFYATDKFTINNNNINDNQEYNISMLEGQANDIDARNNWWGTTDEAKIKEMLRDKDEEAGLGTIIFTDYKTEPITDACKTD